MRQLVDNIMNNKKIDNMYYWLYPFTNENINGYFRQINFQKKDVLTVTSSGDHLLNAIVHGAKNIDAFDINPLAELFVELKIAAIKSLSREEFIGFFYSNTKRFTTKLFFNKTIYKKISENLDGDKKHFWDEFIEKYDSKKINKSKLFTTDFSDVEGLLEANIYLQDGYFDYLKRIIGYKRITYHNIDIKRLDEIGKQFDIILLSNIPAKLDEVYTDGKDHLKDLKLIIDKIIKPGGIAVINYNYANCGNDSKSPDVYDIEKIKKIFPDIQQIFFPSSEKYMYPKVLRKILNYHDSVLITK